MDTDIEHIVATSEAHDSGLCAADRATRKRFATDLRNLTLASPQVNRHQKSGKDAAGWVPDRNRCWFAGRVLEVKRAYRLTVDPREAAALERILRGCADTAMEPKVCRARPMSAGRAARDSRSRDEVLSRYDDNRNGQNHVQGGEAARDCARAPVASGVPVHAGRGWGRGRVRVTADPSGHGASPNLSGRHVLLLALGAWTRKSPRRVDAGCLARLARAVEAGRARRSRVRMKSLFTSAASYYAEFRAPYPKALMARVVAECGLDGRQRLLDLGCGTGEVFLPLLPHLASVVAVDPDPDMLELAKRKSASRSSPDVRFVRTTAEEIDESVGVFELVTAGASFHWMDRYAVGQAIARKLLVPGGTLAIVGSTSLWHGEEPWHAIVRDVIRRWCGETRRAGTGVFRTPSEPHQAVVGAARLCARRGDVRNRPRMVIEDAARVSVLDLVCFARGCRREPGPVRGRPHGVAARPRWFGAIPGDVALPTDPCEAAEPLIGNGEGKSL